MSGGRRGINELREPAFAVARSARPRDGVTTVTSPSAGALKNDAHCLGRHDSGQVAPEALPRAEALTEAAERPTPPILRWSGTHVAVKIKWWVTEW